MLKKEELDGGEGGWDLPTGFHFFGNRTKNEKNNIRPILMFPELSFKRKVVDGVFHCPPSLEGKRVSNPNPFCHFVSDFIERKKFWKTSRATSILQS
jgi:hypothetical protein